MDFFRLVFGRLAQADNPDEAARAAIYEECRQMVREANTDPKNREKALADLEKVIRRQEMQAIYVEWNCLKANDLLRS